MKNKLKGNKGLLWGASFLILVLLFLNAIHQILLYTEEYYLISSLKKDIACLALENRELEISFSQSNSLRHLGKYAQDQFVKADKVEYIRIMEETALAR